jgi:hypothetical protein
LATKTRFQVGDILQVTWKDNVCGIIEITGIFLFESNTSYQIKHLDNNLPLLQREADLRSIEVIDNRLYAKIATKAARILYGSK